MNIVDQLYWDEGYKNLDYYIANDDVTFFIDYWLKKLETDGVSISNCFEVGCFPGRYLAHIAKKFGIEANGVDKTTQLNGSFITWLESIGVRVGEIYHDDAFLRIEQLQEKKCSYDFVYSVGFIEHFSNYMDIIKAHGDILHEGGVLIITTPNFAGFFQRIAHLFLDKDNFNRHVLESMVPKKWANEMEKAGYKVVFTGYFGKFDFWVDKQERKLIQKLLIKILLKSKSFFKKIIRKNRRCFAPYCGMVLIKM